LAIHALTFGYRFWCLFQNKYFGYRVIHGKSNAQQTSFEMKTWLY